MILTFPGGLVFEAENGLKISDVFKNYLPSAYKTAIAARVDGKIAELSDVLTSDCYLAPITFSDEDGKNIYRHTCAHVLAMAVKHIYPTVKLALGPAIENGFYYDFEFKTPISREDFQKIEAEMRKIIKANLPITKKAVPKKEALAVMKSFDEDYKVQIIESMPKNERAVLYRRFYRALQRSAPRFHGKNQSLQAYGACGSLLAGQRKQQDAHPNLRNGVRQKIGA